MKFLADKGYSFDDVLLVPREGVLSSRSKANLSTRVTKHLDIDIPIVSAPMSTVTGSALAIAMAEVGGLGIIHRNMSIEDQVDEWNRAANFIISNFNRDGEVYEIGCAIGLNERLLRIDTLYEQGCRVFCIDVAHAHTKALTSFLASIHGAIWEECEIIVGSIATAEAVDWLSENFRIAAFRVGIGSGAACTTRRQTGFGVPQLTAIIECAQAANPIPIIADGGIKNSGDIIKALAAGASSVMLGRLLAGAFEAPKPGEYYGMASYNAHKEKGRLSRHIEGESGKIEIVGSVKDIIEDLLAGIRSGLSYGGAQNIIQLQENAIFRPVAEWVNFESEVRI